MAQHDFNSKNKISNQGFLTGCQCVKALHLTVTNPNLAVTDNTADNHKTDELAEIKTVAKRLFSEGIDARQSNNYLSTRRTLELISQDTNIIYNATLQYDNVVCTIDVLSIENNIVKGYLIKGATKPKTEYELEGAFLYYMFSKFGITLNDVQVIYVNSSYERASFLDTSKLFQFQSLKENAMNLQIFVKEKLDELKHVIISENVKKNIGLHCHLPHDCNYIEHCWKHIPPVSIFDLVRLPKTKKFALYGEGIIEFNQLPSNIGLSDAQQRQVDSYLQKKDIINKNAIKKFVEDIEYPIAYIDFETVQFAIPPYKNLKSYAQIPFQFSLHFKAAPDADLYHTEFLAQPNKDPRIEFIKAFLDATSVPVNTFFTYNMTFEIGRLIELSKQFPKYANAINDRVLKIKDLMLPFSKGWYYTSQMNGSYSIKKVLPALAPELSYDHLAINNGTGASSAFKYLRNCNNANEILEIRNHLLKYCMMDTLAMVRIFEKLEALAQTS